MPSLRPAWPVGKRRGTWPLRHGAEDKYQNGVCLVGETAKFAHCRYHVPRGGFIGFFEAACPGEVPHPGSVEAAETGAACEPGHCGTDAGLLPDLDRGAGGAAAGVSLGV